MSFKCIIIDLFFFVNLTQIPIPISAWKFRQMRQIGRQEGKMAWLKELETLQKNRNQCGHGRLQELKKCPIIEQEEADRKCLHLWGTTRFAVLTGCFASVLDSLEEYGIPMQHGKVTLNYYDGAGGGGEKTVVIDKNTFAGLYIGHENFAQSPKDVLKTLVELYAYSRA